jgi:hypothetical protein
VPPFRASDDDTSSTDEHIESDSENEDVYLPNAFDCYKGPDLWSDLGDEIKPMSEMEAVLFMLDLMACHKTTDELGKSVWDLLRAALGDQGLVTFNSVKNLLKKFQGEHVLVVDICVNDCMAFHDCEEAKGWEPYLKGHMTVCEHCNEPRYVVDPKTGARKARKVSCRSQKISFT